MGLDMYITNNDTDEETNYWRNHYELHDTFQKLALTKI